MNEVRRVKAHPGNECPRCKRLAIYVCFHPPTVICESCGAEWWRDRDYERESSHE
jgi:uncharacterized protein (DUF983 family)